jgi:hypothetical protein
MRAFDRRRPSARARSFRARQAGAPGAGGKPALKPGFARSGGSGADKAAHAPPPNGKGCACQALFFHPRGLTADRDLTCILDA